MKKTYLLLVSIATFFCFLLASSKASAQAQFCPGTCQGSTLSQFPDGHECIGVDGESYTCVAPSFMLTSQIPDPDPIDTDSGTSLNADAATLDSFNQTIFGAGGPDVNLTTPRGVISRLLPYLFTFAGLILFIMIIWGGFELLSGAANPKSQEAGKQRITNALVGFVLLFSSYWLAQIVETVFGISIL